MATHVVTRGSLCRHGVVLKNKTNLYFYRMWYGISYFQNYYSIPNSIPPPFHDIILIRKALKLCPSTQLPNHLEWILVWINIKSPPADSLLKTWAVYSSETLHPSSHVFLIKTILCFFTNVRAWSKELQNISDKSVDGSCWENWITSHIIFITNLVFNAAVLCTTSVLEVLLLP